MERGRGKQLQLERWADMMRKFYNDPKAAQLMDTRFGQYLRGHPYLALTLLVFSTMAALPVGLFLVFALLTVAASAVGFFVFEAVLLSFGGVTLLCVLSGVALVSVFISAAFTAFYGIINTMSTRQSPKMEPRSREDKVRGA